MLAVTEFKISKLFGKNDIALKFRDNMLILVGENGSGKTTILRIMYLFLSGRHYSNMILRIFLFLLPMHQRSY